MIVRGRGDRIDETLKSKHYNFSDGESFATFEAREESMAMGARMASREIPAELLALITPVAGDWNERINFGQQWVTDYTRVTRDPNEIHQEGWRSKTFPKPIVPVLMVLAVSDCLVKGGIKGVFLGRVPIFREVCQFKPKRSVAVGQDLQLRYRIANVSSDIGGVYADVEIDVRIAEPAKVVATGVLSFYLRESHEI